MLRPSGLEFASELDSFTLSALLYVGPDQGKRSYPKKQKKKLPCRESNPGWPGESRPCYRLHHKGEMRHLLYENGFELLMSEG